jgi:hypothetical protein
VVGVPSKKTIMLKVLVCRSTLPERHIGIVNVISVSWGVSAASAGLPLNVRTDRGRFAGVTALMPSRLEESKVQRRREQLPSLQVGAPPLHENPHADPLQVAVLFAGCGQVVHDVVPQLAVLVFDAQAPPHA